MDYKKIWNDAVQAGKKALKKCKPTPVIFQQVDLDDTPLDKGEYCEDGECGGAYIILWDKNDDFVKWILKNKPKEISENYRKGYMLYLSESHKGYRGQSAEKFEACANAFAKVLEDNGIHCSVKMYLS